MYDLIIVGGGPAGLTAALYARRANKNVLVIEKDGFGGQITFSPKVENIPGFKELSGMEFADLLTDQVLHQGAETENCEVLSVEEKGDAGFIVHTDEGDFEGLSVIIATGAKHRVLGLEGEEELIGNGISFCAVCDGAFYKDKNVVVVGGGNSALQEALLLSDLVSKLTIVQNLPVLTGEEKLREQLFAKDNVEIIYSNVLKRYITDESGELCGIEIVSEENGETKELSCDGVFLAVGLLPQNEAFKNILNLDERGYAAADETLTAPKKGVFVAGDCRAKRIRQVATAAADGAVAAIAACDYVDSLRG